MPGTATETKNSNGKDPVPGQGPERREKKHEPTSEPVFKGTNTPFNLEGNKPTRSAIRCDITNRCHTSIFRLFPPHHTLEVAAVTRFTGRGSETGNWPGSQRQS